MHTLAIIVLYLVSLGEKQYVPEASRTHQHVLIMVECTGLYQCAGQVSSVNCLHSSHRWSSQGTIYRSSDVHDGFGSFVCVFITLSPQNIIVHCGLDSGFLLWRSKWYKYVVNFY